MRTYAVLIPLMAALLMQDVRMADVRGSVFDMEGKPIANAQVILKNPANGKTYQFSTNNNGEFRGIGLAFGEYEIEITNPEGRRIFSGKRKLLGGNQQNLNVIQIDLSLIPPKASLTPFKGMEAEATAQRLKDGDMSPEQARELRQVNGMIARFNRLTPEVQEALRKENWRQAADLLKQIIAVAPYEWEPYQNLGSVQMHLGQFQAAADSFEKSIQFVMKDSGAHVEGGKNKVVAEMLMAQGEAYSALDNPDAVVYSYRRATAVEPKFSLAHFRLCIAEYNNGGTDNAIKACNKAIAIDPAPEFFQGLAGIYSNLGRYQDSIETYEKGIQVAEGAVVPANTRIKPTARMQLNVPRIGQMLLSEGNVYFQLRDFERAAALFESATHVHTYPALAYFNLCATLFDMDRMKDAVDACGTAITLDPRMAVPYYVRGTALYAEGVRHHAKRTPEGTVQALEKYLELAPEGLYADDAKTMLQEISRLN
ncbi:MAG TPA: tetratricopeptide repeat protein [Candidatus Angelobacter sp.]